MKIENSQSFSNKPYKPLKDEYYDNEDQSKIVQFILRRILIPTQMGFATLILANIFFLAIAILSLNSQQFSLDLEYKEFQTFCLTQTLKPPIYIYFVYNDTRGYLTVSSQSESNLHDRFTEQLHSYSYPNQSLTIQSQNQQQIQAQIQNQSFSQPLRNKPQIPTQQLSDSQLKPQSQLQSPQNQSQTQSQPQNQSQPQIPQLFVTIDQTPLHYQELIDTNYQRYGSEEDQYLSWQIIPDSANENYLYGIINQEMIPEIYTIHINDLGSNTTLFNTSSLFQPSIKIQTFDYFGTGSLIFMQLSWVFFGLSSTQLCLMFVTRYRIWQKRKHMQ